MTVAGNKDLQGPPVAVICRTFNRTAAKDLASAPPHGMTVSPAATDTTSIPVLYGSETTLSWCGILSFPQSTPDWRREST